MTHVSRKKLSNQTEKEIISALKSTFIKLAPKDVDRVFSALITETEQTMLAKRLVASVMLFEGATYEQVSNSLNLTEQTISKIQFEMNSSQNTYEFLYSKLTPWKRKELLKVILKDLGSKGLKLFAKHAGGRIS